MSDITVQTPTPLECTASFDGTQLDVVIQIGGIPDAPKDGKTYGRKDGNWDEVEGGGVTVHNDLTDRDADDAHPISAITGLQDELNDKLESGDLPTVPAVINDLTDVTLTDRTEGRYLGFDSGGDVVDAAAPTIPTVITVGRLDIDHTDTAFAVGDLNTYMEADDTGGEVTLNIPDSFGEVGDAMVVRKVGDVNDLVITAAGTDDLIGDSKVTTQYHIIHLLKVTATRWNATGGVE